ncbi:MAG: pyruvate dehydrogenase complex dihydrolipoamide acetyltransferase [Bacteroidota bacterium]|jgi:pyruvate dehydrogenase E2 component (dihydrolipoamide acetyltransferase)
MAEVVKMPKLSDTMTEGVVALWHKKVGDKIKSGDLLADIQTDKATMEFESFYDGVLLHIGVEKGQAAPVDAILAIIGKEGEDITSILNSSVGSITESKTENSTAVSVPQAIVSSPIPSTINVVRMPKLSDTMTEGVVAKWNKKVGDKVKNGEVLAEINTDKATMEFESFYDGVLLYVGVEEGKGAPVDSILAVIGKGDENIQSVLDSLNNSSSQTVQEVAKPVSQPSTSANVQQTSKASESVATNATGRIKASPLAKKIAKDKGIDITAVVGTGENGRIIKKDVEQFVPTSAKSSVSSSTATHSSGVESYTEENVSMMRKTIARRLAESKFSAPHFYLTMEIDMDKAIEARTAINTSLESKISFNDMVVKAVAQSLKKHPNINSSWLGDKIRRNHHINVGVAVAVPEGLLVPVVRFTDTKSLSQISSEIKEYGKKAKENKLQPSDWEGNTFTISNLGMFGIDEFTAIINPPDACILAVGGIKSTPVVKNGQIVPGNLMKVTLSCDHRVVDGATGAAFLQTLKQYLENPVLMLA